MTSLQLKPLLLTPGPLADPSTTPHLLRSGLSISGKVPLGTRSNKNGVSHTFPFVLGLAAVSVDKHGRHDSST